MNEIWKDIVGYEGQYQVSNLGNVVSLNYKRSGSPHLLKPTITYDGYYRVHIGGKKRPLQKTVHIFVAEAFIPNPDNKPQVNHKDGNKANNSVSNLEWVTGKENIIHSLVTGLRKPENHIYPKGSDHYCSKPVLQYDLKGNFIRKWDCQSEAARFYSCDPCTIINCMHERIQSCKGYIWREYTDNYPLNIAVKHHHLSPRIIRQYTKDGVLINTWNDYQEIMKANPGYKAPSLSACCKGTQKTAYGYIWKMDYTN